MIHNKLVRDRIPAIIEAAGERPVVRMLDTGAYRAALGRKLAEELDEFTASGEIEELADLVEVVRAILAERGLSWDELEHIRSMKHAERGGFEDRLWLEAVESAPMPDRKT